MNKLIIVLIIVALSISAFVFRESITGNVTSDTNVAITIPLSEISEEANWYEYDFGNTKIKYFAVQANDGSIKTAFNECDVCFGSKRGYRQEGEFMVCNNCGNKYPIVGLGTENRGGGGCWPGYLPSQVEGDKLVISVSDIEKGARLFK